MKIAKGIYMGIKETFNPNKKSSAVMDTIVVQQPDGTLRSSPFHVHFGILKLLDSENKFIDIFHQGQHTGICMILDKHGEGSFYRVLHRRTVFEPPKLLPENSEKEKLNSSAGLESFQGLLDNSDSNTSFYSDPGEYKEPPQNNLTSDELKSLKLNPGLNVIDFVARHNPTIYLRGKVYLWQHDSKIVISDIDGTLTKSDLMGHLCQLVGKDWTRGGVVYFYNNLISKGYKILYLTARSLSQIDSTRSYLMQIYQDRQTLPDGPLILNHVGMMNALISELAKKSRIFKEKVLREIGNLFPENPFHSGIGNRLGDGLAYAAIGIHKELIFIIDKKGKEKGDHVSIKNFKDPRLKIDLCFPRIS